MVVRAGLVCGVQKAVHAAAGTDYADAKRVVCSENAGGCQGSQARGDKETAAIRWILHGGILTSQERLARTKNQAGKPKVQPGLPIVFDEPAYFGEAAFGLPQATSLSSSGLSCLIS